VSVQSYYYILFVDTETALVDLSSRLYLLLGSTAIFFRQRTKT